MNTTMKDRYGNELHVTSLVVSRFTAVTHLDTKYLEAGTVYPAGFLLNGDLAVIDADNEVTPVREDTVVRIAGAPGEVMDFARIDAAYTKAGFTCGEVVPFKEEIPTRHKNKGCVWCLNQAGNWIALPKFNLTFIKPKMSAAAMTARMKSATEQGTSQVLVVNLNAGAGAGGSGTLSVRQGGSSINFIPAPEKLDNVVRVEFQPGGKLYTYRLKDGMIAHVGDDEVVVVNNPSYPELKGTKVVRVKEIDQVENLGGSYKFVEHIVSNEEERRKQAQAKRDAAKRKIYKKSQQVQEVVELLARLETELNVMTEEFNNDFN